VTVRFRNVDASPTDDVTAGRLFTLALRRARADAEGRGRAEVAARVRAAIAASGLTASAFAQEVDTSASRMSTFATGRVVPSAAMLVRIERRGYTER
jgi:ribosome-binding protein aMBF1 (putative translation factor)